MIRTCIFPVAGLGTRFLPATKSIPKEMLVVVDKPLIQYAVEEAKAAGIERFIFVTSQGKSSIEDHFDSHPMLEQTLLEREQTELLDMIRSVQLKMGQAIYIRQSKPLGLGHAIYCARHFVHEETFAIILADDLIQSFKPCLKQMMECYIPGTQMVATEDVGYGEIHRYGCLDLAGGGPLYKVKSVIEKPKKEEAPSSHAIVGRYILPSSIFFALENAASGAQGEIQITDAIARTTECHPLMGFAFEGRKYDCGTRDGWLKANLSYAFEDPILKAKLQPFMREFL